MIRCTAYVFNASANTWTSHGHQATLYLLDSTLSGLRKRGHGEDGAHNEQRDKTDRIHDFHANPLNPVRAGCDSNKYSISGHNLQSSLMVEWCQIKVTA
jgi:hypothetical protein